MQRPKLNLPTMAATALVAAILLPASSMIAPEFDPAFAAPPTSTAAPAASSPKPWASAGIGLSVTGLIFNSIFVSQTQCRELTQQEAFTSAALPFIGMAFNSQNPKCPR